MKNLFFVFLLLNSSLFLQAQYTVRIIVNSVATKPNDAIYLSGNFNEWNPANDNYKLKPFGGGRLVVVLNDMKPGNYEYKFTRGNWSKAETTAKGEDIDNRTFIVNGDTSIEVSIAGWKDDFPDKPIPNTASANVHVLDSAFFIPQLNRYRRIWIYLPASYQKEKNKSYPVLYMQDGQNLFNEQTAAFHTEWGIDECLDTLAQQLHKEFIVV
jgi:metallo-beta-lactamase class B